MSPPAALYFGHVMHSRMRPFRHAFRYRVFSLLVDIDRLGEAAASTRLFSINRFNLFSFHERDHGPRDGSALRPWLDRTLAEAGIATPPAIVRLLCFPRILGYVFNPLSIYYCHDADDRLNVILYEVKNTFGGQHSYVIPVGRNAATPIRQSAAKDFYVSPFIGMESRYRFRMSAPGERLSVVIHQTVPDGDMLIATQNGVRAPFDDRRLLGAFIRYPLMTFKVIGAIHWQALRLWLKGAKLVPRPPAPERPVSRGTLSG
ncbi:MAG: DUF1365 domain-containing protein [Alphaproteobacteria bacterium]|nr:DUF1365 domain-containing protein [Alphaproteobacteria bacterium]